MACRILIVRTSSLGDIIQAFPAISDIAKHLPGSKIDWVVEENFLEIPRWHSKVNAVLSIAHRRWRNSWWSNQVRMERCALANYFQEHPYDFVLDMQGLLKSAWLTNQAIGERHGLNWKSAREPIASFFYDKRHRVEFWKPAVTRHRLLASMALGYQYSGPADFGLGNVIVEKEKEEKMYIVLMPSSSRRRKFWVKESWLAVVRYLNFSGYQLILLAGNEQEKRYAECITLGISNSKILTKVNFSAIKNLILGARFMIGLDTGLTHLSAALGLPTLGIYCRSSSIRTGLVGRNFTASLGNQDSPPSLESVISTVKKMILLYC